MVDKVKAPSTTPNQDNQTAASATDILNALGFGDLQAQNDSGNRSSVGSSTSTTVTRLTYQSAKSLLEAVMREADFMGKLTPADIKQFVVDFSAAQDKQIEKVVVSSSSKTTAGATKDATSKVVDSTKKTEFPSFFDAKGFANDFIWSKINFKDEKTLGAKSLSALSDVRGVVQAFQLMGVTDNDIRAAAKEIAMGRKTLDAYKVELQQIAKKEYPQFADRFDTDPTLTTYDIASPIIKMLAKTWEVEEDQVKMDNPIVMSYMNYAGPDGKGQAPSRYDLLLKAKKDPKYQLTQQANEDARDAATGLARAFGFGV
jgi:hypothetical protein